MQTLIAVVVILVLVILFIVATYNRLIARRNRVANNWSQIDVQLKRRYDLIPNLINSVKGYMEHEKSLLDRLTETRSKAIAAGDNVKERGVTEGVITQMLRSVFAVVENYPDLKANQNMLALQEELSSTENKIAFARQGYNDSVMEFNTALQSFPANLVVNSFGFKESEFFELEDQMENRVPEVQF